MVVVESVVAGVVVVTTMPVVDNYCNSPHSYQHGAKITNRLTNVLTEVVDVGLVVAVTVVGGVVVVVVVDDTAGFQMLNTQNVGS